MQKKLLDTKHECYSGYLCAKYNALYEGGQTFRANIKEFLTKNLLEDNYTYERRKNEANYESHVNTLVNQFASQLFSSPFVVRTEPENADQFYSDFKEDVDLNGEDLLTLAHKMFVGSLIKGCSWALAEMPDDGNLPPENLLEQNERGLGRAWLKLIKTEDVFDYETDEFGQLKWIITHSIEKRRDNPRLERKIITETWKLYDQEEVETFQVSYEQNKKPTPETDIPSLGKIKHKFTRVPFLCLELPKGLWLLNKLADAQIEHFRANNALGWAMRRACYPTAVFKTDNDESGKLERSADGFGVKIGKDEDLSWITPPTESFEIIFKRVTSLRDEMYRLALQMALDVDNSSGSHKRSGESKAQDQKPTEIILYAYADIVKAFIEEIFELISDARGDIELTFSIEGMDKFVIDDSEAIMNAATQAKMFNIPSDTFKKELAYKLSNVLLPQISQSVKDQIKKEIMESEIEELEPKSTKDPLKKEDQKKPNSKENLDV